MAGGGGGVYHLKSTRTVKTTEKGLLHFKIRRDRLLLCMQVSPVLSGDCDEMPTCKKIPDCDNRGTHLYSLFPHIPNEDIQVYFKGN